MSYVITEEPSTKIGLNEVYTEFFTKKLEAYKEAINKAYHIHKYMGGLVNNVFQDALYDEHKHLSKIYNKGHIGKGAYTKLVADITGVEEYLQTFIPANENPDQPNH
jgi:hypothetical protein